MGGNANELLYMYNQALTSGYGSVHGCKMRVVQVTPIQ